MEFGQLLTFNVLLVAAIAATGIWFLLQWRSQQNRVRRRLLIKDEKITEGKSLGAEQRNSFMGKLFECLASVSGFEELNEQDVKSLRGRLIQGGFFDRRAVAWFFGLRFLCLMLALVITAGILFTIFEVETWNATIGVLSVAGLVGYMAPSVLLSRVTEKNKREFASAFPDFMDLMIVCTQAGMSIEAGIDRVASELKSSYPTFCRNLELTTVEMRSGKAVSKAIDSFAKRLGIAEAQSFATLLAQSEDLGASISQSLRAYSEDMRNKRLTNAEEKAASLPAKLVVPLTLFVFPTLMVVLLLPVVISVSMATF